MPAEAPRDRNFALRGAEKRIQADAHRAGGGAYAAGHTVHGERPQALEDEGRARPRPEYVYAKTNEDEYNIYENRAVKALIDRVIRLLDIPTEQAKGGVKNLYEAYFQSSSLSKLDLVKLMDMDLFKTSDGRAFENYKKLYYLRAKFSQLKNSAFYKIMSNCPAFAGAIEATNLLPAQQKLQRLFPPLALSGRILRGERAFAGTDRLGLRGVRFPRRDRGIRPHGI